jgi:peptidoglycan hydrolase-like protein with peptidoglycan-binding domain
MQVADPTGIDRVNINNPILQQDAEGEDVAELQRLLKLWGAFSGRVDGKFDSLLYEAVRAWQQRVFLPETGIVDRLTWHTLYTGGPVDMPVLRLGTRDRTATLLQVILQKAGFNWHQVTGEFDTLTEIAVRDFQRRCGLVTDGVVGYYTWRALSKLKH